MQCVTKVFHTNAHLMFMNTQPLFLRVHSRQTVPPPKTLEQKVGWGRVKINLGDVSVLDTESRGSVIMMLMPMLAVKM